MEQLNLFEIKSKICSKCGEEKELKRYYRNSIQYFCKVCKNCNRLYNLIWRHNNPEKIKKYNKKHYSKERSRNASRVWRKNNPEKEKEYQKKWKSNNLEKVSEYGKRNFKKKLESNPSYAKDKSAKWRKNNLKKARELDRGYSIKRRATPQGRIDDRMSSMMWFMLKKGKGGQKWENLVSYTKDELKNYLERLFTEGMNWEEFMKSNIHIDHIKPRCLFRYESYNDEEFKKCWALENLQPLWAKDNLKKNKKYEELFD